MTATLLAAVAGLPPEIVDPFTQRLTREHRKLRVVAAPPLPLDATYSGSYVNELYRRVANGLRSDSNARCLRRWGLNLVVLFLENVGDGQAVLLERFGLEALLVPLDIQRSRLGRAAPNQRNGLVNDLLAKARQQIIIARNILAAVAQDVTVRDNRTSMLLPRRNFGKALDHVSEFVGNSVAKGMSGDTFREGLRTLEAGLRKDSEGYFEGKGGLVYRAPPKAGARHGIAPNWNAGDHTNRCVIRGHLRFGAAFEPNFHYDCKLGRGSTRQFVSCHGEVKLKRGRTHVNIAPNDNIR